MKKKILSILLCTLLVANSLLIIQTDHVVSADTETTEYYCPLNLTYVKMIAENLSQIINKSYDQNLQEKGLAKGRYFGTPGEHVAARWLSNQMKNISLFPCSNDSYPFWERVEDHSGKSSNSNSGNLTTKFDILDKSLTITNHSNGSTIRNKTIDCYISPRWTLDGNTFEDRLIPWNKSKLTRSFEYHNLSVFHLIADYIGSDFNETIYEILTLLYNMTQNETDFYLMTAFEQRYNFSFDDVEAHPENITRLPWYNATLCDNQSFVLIREDRTYNPNWPETPLRVIIIEIDIALKRIRNRIDRLWPHCEGVILYDYDNLSHDFSRNDQFKLPVIFINGTDGQQIINNIRNYTVNLSFSQQWNTTVESYNLIGQINGTDSNRSHIVIINSLYDSVWSSGTADSAIGCGIVLALARYYTEHHLKPKYTTQFVLFAGEEAGVKGANSYKAKHKNYTIEKFIDLNQLCFTQPWPETRLYVGTNRLLLKPYIEQIADEKNYETHMKNTKLEVIYRFLGLMSDDMVYSGLTDRSDTITFLKGMTWYHHHRDGMNHIQGDSMKYYNDTDVAATSNIVFNISRYFALNPNCRFLTVDQPWLKDTDHDQSDSDSIQVNYTLNTTLPQDRVWVKATLISQEYPILCRYKEEKHYLTTPDGTSGSISITLPTRAPKGHYQLTLFLYNSTGEVQRNVTHLFDYLDFGMFANDTNVTGPFYMSPQNDPPYTPQQPQGDSELHTNEVHTYTTSATDPNNDDIWYQWKWETKIRGHPLTYYTMWVTGGPYQSGATCPHIISWSEEGTYNIWVRAKDNIFNPNVMSDWSPYKTIHVTKGDGGSSWNTQFIDSFSLDTVAVNQQTFCGGFNQNVVTGGQSNSIVNWTWDFGDGNFSYGENASHNYSQVGNYTICLSIHDDHNNYLNCSQNITVIILNAGFHTSGDWQPEKQVRFNDSSAGHYPIVNWTWDFGDGNTSHSRNATHSYCMVGCYNVTLTVRDNHNNTHFIKQPIEVELMPPELAQVVVYPNSTISGTPVTIAVDLLDNQSGVKEVKVNITTPNNISINATMVSTNLTEYDYTYTFNETWRAGVYNYSIWVKDNANNTNITPGFNFTILRTPIIDFEPPTPVNASIVNHTWTQINTTVRDNHFTSAFIDWNRSLKGYWPMDFYNNTGIYDKSTFHNFGKFEGGGTGITSIKTGKYGKAVEFDGYNDDVDLGLNSSLSSGTGNFTFMVWENSDQNHYTNKAVILTNRPVDAFAKGYCFGVQNKSYLYVTQSSGSNVTLNGNADVTDHLWHHIAYVRKGTNYSIYVDGAYDAGVTGAMKNITNSQHTYLAYGHMTGYAYFDGLLDEPQLYNRALSREEINASYNNGLYLLYHNFTGLSDGTYDYYTHAIDTTGNESETETRWITIDALPPMITDVNASLHTVGFGYNVTITADVVDNGSSVDLVTVQITPPGGVGNSSNHSMTLISNNTYQYVFTDTWLTGQYNYTIWATDDNNNTASSSGHHFHVSAQATISIATLKNSYSGTQYINITDPPNPPENLTLVGRGLTWNTYYNASSGENILETYQGPVNYQEDNGTWTPINNSFYQLASNHPAYVYGYRNGNDQGLYGVYFKSNAQNDWPIAFTYNRSDDPTTHVIRSKLVGVGYVDPQNNWAYQYLQNVQSSQGQTSDYSITYPGVFTGTDVTWSYGNTGLKEEITMSNTTKTVLQNHPPSQYGLNDTSSYLVFITKLDYQNLNLYNGSGVLDGNVTISDAGVDFKDVLGQFKCALPLGEAFELNNESMREKLTYRIIHLNGNTYLLSGLKVSDLNAMTFPVVVDPTLTVYSTSSDGYIYKSSGSYNTAWTASTGTVSNSAAYISIGQKKDASGPPTSTYSIYRGFVFFNTSALPSNAYLDNATLSLYKKDDYSTTDFDITIQNGQPTYPYNPMQSGDYVKSHYSGNGGALNTSRFGSGYNAIRMNDLSWINKTGITKFCLRSSRDISGIAPTGNEYVNVHSNEFLGSCPPKLVINYRNQSKIKNTGSTDIKGYLLIQVQFYNTSQAKWLVDNDTINETSPRTITSGNQLALDTIFNGHVRASDLTYGTGTYRVYTAFRDPEGNILRTNDDVDLEAWWQFSKT